MIHPTAVISDETELGDNVTIGPYAVLEGKNTVGDGAKIMAHSRLADSTIGKESILTPFAKIEKSTIGDRCKIGCELRKCNLGDRVQASHTNIVLENATLDGYANFSSGTTFAVRGGPRDDDGNYIKAKLSVGKNVFIGLYTALLPKSDNELYIGNDVFIAADLNVRHDIPDAHTVYPRSAVEYLQSKGQSFDIIKTTESYCILNRNKMKEDDIMKHR